MILIPQKKERIQKIFLKTYIDEEEPIPTQIQVFLFDEIESVVTATQSEFMARRTIMNQISGFNCFVDSIEAWKITRDNDIIKLIIMGENGKKNCIKILTYFLKKYNLPLESITLNFYDEDFILNLYNSI